MYEEMLTGAHIANLQRERQGACWSRAWSRMMHRDNEAQLRRDDGRGERGAPHFGGTSPQA